MSAVPATRTVLVANPSADLYGSDRMVREAVEGLVRLGWRVIVTCSVDGPLVPVLRKLGAEVHVLHVPIIRKSILRPLGMLSLLRDIVVSMPRMLRLIRTVKPGVVLSNTVTVPFWTVAARLLRKPAVVYVHEAEASLSRPARLLLTAPLALATGVVFNSETSRRVTGGRFRGDDDRVRVVHNGVRGPVEAAAPRPTLSDPLRIVYVGRLSPRKGVDLVLEAAAQLHSSGVSPHVDLVGDVFPGYEWYEAQLREQAAELGITDRVRFHGFQPDVWPALSAADIAVVPSRLDESFGNVLIEAVLCARPVIAADHTGLQEAAAGFSSVTLVPRDDAAAISDAVGRLAADWDDYRARSLADAATARSEYDPSVYRERISNALAYFAARRRR